MSSGTTTLRKRPYPITSDAPVVAQDIENLANSVDTTPTFGVGTLANRPSTGMAAGDQYFVSGDTTPSNNGTTFQYDGAKWICPHAMADGRVGEIREYTGTTDPVDPDGVTRWVLADGRPLSRTGYPIVFALWAETWGAGDGTSTFNIPDRRGRVSVGAGQGSGLTARTLAQTGGEETHELSASEMPQHTHVAAGGTGDIIAPSGVSEPYVAIPIQDQPAGSTSLWAGALTEAGGNAPHNNMQPFVGVNFIVRVQ